MPGCIICFDCNQISLFNKLFINNQNSFQNCLHISCFADHPLINTTINGDHLYFYEMCIRRSDGPAIQTVNAKSTEKENNQLIPLTCMLTTKPMSESCLQQWLITFFSSEKNLFFNRQNSSNFNCKKETNEIKYLICDNSMPLVETLLKLLNNESLNQYSNRCFKECLLKQNNKSNSLPNSININKTLNFDFEEINSELDGNIEKEKNDDCNKIILHTCTNLIMNEISGLCKYYYSFGNNFNFGMYAFSCIANSQSIIELEKSLYAFMCILYSQTINSVVEKAFQHLKSTVNYYEKLYRIQIQHDQQVNKAKNKSKNSSTRQSSNNDNNLNDIAINNANVFDTEYYFYNFDLKENSETKRPKEKPFAKETDNNVGLVALQRPSNTNHKKSAIEDIKLDKLNEKSPFYLMCEKLFEKCKKEVDECEKKERSNSLSKNPRIGRVLLYYFIRQFSATMPLWTKIMVPEVSKDSHCDQTIPNFPLTLKSHNDRFRMLSYSIASNGDEKDTIDSFIKRLYEENCRLVEQILEDDIQTTKDIENVANSTQSSLESLVSDKLNYHNISSGLKMNLTNKQNSYLILDQACSDEDLDICRKKILKKNKSSNLMNDNVKICKKKNELIRKKINKNVKTKNTNINEAFNSLTRSKIEPSSLNNNSENITNFNNNENITLIVRHQNSSNENESEIVIQRQTQILSNAFGFEITKDDLDSLDSIPNTNVKFLIYIDSCIRP